MIRVSLLKPKFACRVKAIAEYRQQNGDFRSREELKKVKGIGEKVFVQCAGFIRIRSTGLLTTGAAKKSTHNMLDATSIHPESYGAAAALVKSAGCLLADLGSPEFRRRIQAFAAERRAEELAAELGVGVPTLQLMLEALRVPLEHDLREEFAAPLFRSGLARLEDVRAGAELTGRVSNVTDFGAFVDVGLGKDGLLHVR